MSSGNLKVPVTDEDRRRIEAILDCRCQAKEHDDARCVAGLRVPVLEYIAEVRGTLPPPPPKCKHEWRPGPDGGPRMCVVCGDEEE